MLKAVVAVIAVLCGFALGYGFRRFLSGRGRGGGGDAR